MRTKTALKISKALLIIRDYYDSKSNNQPFSKFKLETAQHYLDEIVSYIDSKSPDIERDFLFFCLGELDDLIEEGDNEKISRFANAVHRIPFIFCGEEKWDKDFKKKYIFPFCDRYGYDVFSEILEMKVTIATISPKNKSAGTASIYRYNEMNIMSLPAYFCFRLMFPLLVLPFIIGAILYVHFYDYTESNRGERYVITVDSFEYEHTDSYDYLSIKDNDFDDMFEISRFFELSNSPEQLIELCESKASLVVYAKYVQHQKVAPYYNVIHLEDTKGNVFRSYEQSNQMDRYLLNLLFLIFFIVFIPSIIICTMMLTVAINPRKYINHPKFVKFCFPNYSLKLK